MKRKILENLIDWKKNGCKKPLILEGARQIGKTHIIKEFAKKEFVDSVYINFEQNKSISSIFEQDFDIGRIIKELSLYFNISINEDTLLIFDEVQASNKVLTSLKYFNENERQYNIIAAGSLLGIALNREDYSFPVGKVDILKMYPLSFEEYLWTKNNDILINEIKIHFDNNTKIENSLHEKLLSYYREYLTIGGMPEVVKTYIETNDFLKAKDIQSEILYEYERDIVKYESKAEANKIIATFDTVPNQLAKVNQKFMYKLIKKGATANMYAGAIDWILHAGICERVCKTDIIMPLEMHKDLSSFKIYMNDVGLLVNKANYPLYYISKNDTNGFLEMGPLVENYVATELRNHFDKLYYWESSSDAEIDFVIQDKTDIIPIEVKSGYHTKSRSLDSYIKKYNPKYSIRIS